MELVFSPSDTSLPGDADHYLCEQLRKILAVPPPVPHRCPRARRRWDPAARREYRQICASPKCSVECRKRWAWKMARCLIRSFQTLPPTHMIRLTAFAMLTDRELTKRIRQFLDRLRYRVPLEYLLVNEWSDGHRHVHILVR